MSVFFVRRWIFTFLVVLGIVFIVSVLLKKPGEDPDLIDPVSDSFDWIDVENLTEYRPCRNSVQGRMLIVDERGYLCKRTDLSASGCCHSDGESTHRFHCQDCQLNNCCSVYEHCVSCCLDPKKQALLLEVLSVWRAAPNVISNSITDQFELCLTKCRTSSKSVWHENSYKDNKYKHCFGLTAPEFAPFNRN